MEITPGLICQNGEFFTSESEIHSVFDAHCNDFPNTPSVMLEVLDNSITTEDLEWLIWMGLVTQDQFRKQWIFCNQAKLDSTPDYVPGQKVLQREYVSCQKRGACEAEGKLCRKQSQLTIYTEREVEVLTHTFNGLLNKEIAHKMGISKATVDSHTQNIRIKTGAARKADLVRIAQKLNLNS
ncbi:DNA-binding CsgD family transcriptional regulator [Pedobacter sp. UYP24]